MTNVLLRCNMAVKRDTVKNDTKGALPKYKMVPPDGGWGIAVKLGLVVTLLVRQYLSVMEKNFGNAAPKYKMVPPDGGWGVTILIGLICALAVTVVPLSGFSIIYGEFLKDIGDATSGAALVLSVFTASTNFTGLAANQLLKKLSYRKVGLIGAFIFLTGSCWCTFVTSLYQLILTYGLLQGIGVGLLMPSLYASCTEYFEDRRNLAMSIAQCLIGFIAIFVPVFMETLFDTFGFRGSVAIMAAIGMHTVFGAVVLQPVRWHLKKREASYEEIEKGSEKQKVEGLPLLKANDETKKIEHIGKLENIEELGKLQIPSIWAALDLGLFKDPIYVNVALGLASSFCSDLAFVSILPLLLIGHGFNAEQSTFIITIYYVSDLIGRASLVVLNAIACVKSRHLFLIGSACSAILRIGFTLTDSYWWVISISATLGFFRSLIQTPMATVIPELYGDRFVTAFSLYMVVSGCVSLTIGFINALVKEYTGSDIMVVYVLATASILCAITWGIELIYLRFFNKRNVIIN